MQYLTPETFIRAPLVQAFPHFLDVPPLLFLGLCPWLGSERLWRVSLQVVLYKSLITVAITDGRLSDAEIKMQSFENRVEIQSSVATTSFICPSLTYRPMTETSRTCV